MPARKITRTIWIPFLGSFVFVRRHDWFEWLRRLRQDVAAASAESDGECEEFCEEVCDDCDFYGGSPGECWAACDDGTVWLQQQV